MRSPRRTIRWAAIVGVAAAVVAPLAVPAPASAATPTAASAAVVSAASAVSALSALSALSAVSAREDPPDVTGLPVAGRDVEARRVEQGRPVRVRAGAGRRPRRRSGARARRPRGVAAGDAGRQRAAVRPAVPRPSGARSHRPQRRSGPRRGQPGGDAPARHTDRRRARLDGERPDAAGRHHRRVRRWYPCRRRRPDRAHRADPDGRTDAAPGRPTAAVIVHCGTSGATAAPVSPRYSCSCSAVWPCAAPCGGGRMPPRPPSTSRCAGTRARRPGRRWPRPGRLCPYGWSAATVPPRSTSRRPADESRHGPGRTVRHRRTGRRGRRHARLAGGRRGPGAGPVGAVPGRSRRRRERARVGAGRHCSS